MKLPAFILLLLLHCTSSTAQWIDSLFLHPPQAAKPWVFWYWMQASVSAAGIKADLEAMKEAGIGGAYLMPIKGKANPPLMEPAVEQLTPAWWEMVRYAMKEADRLGLQLGMHVSDGFALAGGPWITPALSMQKVVWTTTNIKGGSRYQDTLSRPLANEGYYRDIAVLAYPAPVAENTTPAPVVTTSKPDAAAQFLAIPGNRENFRSTEPCWIQYAFEQPFTCRSVTIRTSGNNYQAQRLGIEVSDDGKDFRAAGKLEPARHGWQDTDADHTYSIPPVTARYFRFVYDKAGSEPGAEDLDAAKWKQSLKVCGIELSGMPRIHQFEGKSAAIWRISRRTAATQLPDTLCVPLNKIIDLTGKMDAKGHLTWQPPAGNWIVLRIGHTSTGHTNATGGAGRGLECDKFNPAAVRMQFDHWYGEALRKAGPELASRVLKLFHVDSWECGSQNWSPLFRKEFRRRRGYDLIRYLPAMAGIPVQSAATSEQFLHDVRQTVTELVQENFYGTLATLAHEKGCSFSAESVAPVMTGDGMLHYNTVDIPMGEFWLNSPTHDKPNDMLDAISAAHIYGKQLVQAEAFTTLRMSWNEHPGMLKTLGDRNYALGINKFVYHVFTHNPWTDRRPGMTLDGVGLYFQRDQTWWKPGRAWVEYAQRCQALLQQGRPVADIAVFTGSEIPRRSVLPDRLVQVLPGLFGDSILQKEALRLANTGEPLRQMPVDVTASANIADPTDWVDPLHGYAYDSFNPDALLRLAKVNNGCIELPGGAVYRMLVLPGALAMSPDGNLLSREMAARLYQLVKDGATLLVNGPLQMTTGIAGIKTTDDVIRNRMNELWMNGFTTVNNADSTDYQVKHIGKGRVVKGPWQAASFDALSMQPDLLATEASGKRAAGIAWTHRTTQDYDLYFISNQHNNKRIIDLSFRVAGKVPEIWEPVTGEMRTAGNWQIEKERTLLPLKLAPGGAAFVIFRKDTAAIEQHTGANWPVLKTVQSLSGPWKLTFDPAAGGPKEPVVFETLMDWSRHASKGIRYYSGTVVYKQTFNWQKPVDTTSNMLLDLGHVANLATVKVNGIDCGTAWTPPYTVDITHALKPGRNKVEIAVTNTWANRLTGDHALPEQERITRTTAPYRLEGQPLQEAGLLGPVRLMSSLQNAGH